MESNVVVLESCDRIFLARARPWADVVYGVTGDRRLGGVGFMLVRRWRGAGQDMGTRKA